MTIIRTAALLTTVVSLPLCGIAQLKPAALDQFPITTRMVAQTLSVRGIQVEDRQVFLLARVIAAEPHPALDILKVEPLSDSRLEQASQSRTIVKLACHTAAICLPFYATITRPYEMVGNDTGSPGLARPAGYSTLISKPAITMRAGTHATLAMDDERSHVRIAVISLENGATGRKICVTSTDHKKVYLAEVVSPVLLKRSY